MDTDILADALTDPVTADGPPIGPSTLRRIAAAWPRRATVRTDMDKVVGEPDGPAGFDPELPDYPERILPFAGHPRYLAAEPHQRSLVNTLGWPASSPACRASRPARRCSRHTSTRPGTPTCT